MSFLNYASAPVLARWQLADQMIGPLLKRSSDDVAEQTADLAPHEAQEHLDYLLRPLLPRHEHFRTLLDDGAVLLARAATCAAAINRRTPRKWPMLRGEVCYLRGLTDSHLLAQARLHALEAYTELKDSVDRLVSEEFAALNELPWSRDWILSLAAQALTVPGQSFSAGSLRPVGMASAFSVPEVSLDLEEIGLGILKVDRMESKVSQRRALHSAADAVLRERFRHERSDLPDTDATFTRWKGWDSRSAAIRARTDLLLAKTHPRGERPYSLQRQDQIRRDVNLWVRAKIDGQSGVDIAIDSEVEVDKHRNKFLVRGDGTRPRIPTRTPAILLAVRRAHALLMRPMS